MTLELSTRFHGAHNLVEMECRADDCDGRMLVDSKTARRLGLSCPIPKCDAEVVTA